MAWLQPVFGWPSVGTLQMVLGFAAGFTVGRVPRAVAGWVGGRRSVRR